MSKWCKGYCFVEDDKSPEAKKVCNKPGCRNKERAQKLAKKASEKLLREVERHLY